MNAKELAQLLNGREYCEEITDSEELEAKKSGLVVVFGASDDNAEFRGAINDEVGCYDGGDIYVNREGARDPDQEECGKCRKRLKEQSAKIEAVWDKDGYSWTYKTAIPHETFEILEDGAKYCRGIVFSINDLPAI